MLYNAYEMQRTLLAGASNWAAISAKVLNNPALPMGYFGMGPIVASALEVFAHLYEERGKPEFGIDAVEIDGKRRTVSEKVVLEKPFGNLRHFRRAGLPANAPKLLIVAPMSGHYATLLRGTVKRMIEKHEVWVTDWADAKMVPLSEGHFDLDDYIDYLIEFLRFTGEGTHVLAVCQPSVPAFAATAIMAADNDPCRPATLTMMGGPIDTRASPTSVNNLAMEKPLSWFKANVIATVPLNYPGAGRKVYPGFLQLAGFISMNIETPHDEPLRDVQTPHGGRDRGSGLDQAVLRRVSLGLRHDRGILPRDDRGGVPEPFPARAASSSTAASRSTPTRSATRRCWRSRARTTTFQASARPAPRSTSPSTCRWRRRSTTSPATSGTTGSSTAASGATESPPWSRNGLPATAASQADRSHRDMPQTPSGSAGLRRRQLRCSQDGGSAALSGSRVVRRT